MRKHLITLAVLLTASAAHAGRKDGGLHIVGWLLALFQ